MEPEITNILVALRICGIPTKVERSSKLGSTPEKIDKHQIVEVPNEHGIFIRSIVYYDELHIGKKKLHNKRFWTRCKMLCSLFQTINI